MDIFIVVFIMVIVVIIIAAHDNIRPFLFFLDICCYQLLSVFVSCALFFSQIFTNLDFVMTYDELFTHDT